MTTLSLCLLIAAGWAITGLITWFAVLWFEESNTVTVRDLLFAPLCAFMGPIATFLAVKDWWDRHAAQWLDKVVIHRKPKTPPTP